MNLSFGNLVLFASVPEADFGFDSVMGYDKEEVEMGLRRALGQLVCLQCRAESVWAYGGDATQGASPQQELNIGPRSGHRAGRGPRAEMTPSTPGNPRGPDKAMGAGD